MARTATETLLAALRRVFRPLVRMLIERGITYPQLRELLKGLYVDVANDEFAVEGKAPSQSRIFLLTGVHRKDIKRLLSDEHEAEAGVSANAGLGGALVAHWIGDSDYLDAEGAPRPLARSGSENEPGFDQLVTGVSKDIRPRAVLDELLRLGVVEVDADERIVLRREAFVPDSGFDEKVHYMGRHLHDHIAACASNLSEQGEPRFERSVYYDKLSDASIEQLRLYAEEEGMALLKRINARARELQQEDATQASGADKRMRFGAYWFDAGKNDET